MKLAVSNIAWGQDTDQEMYHRLQQMGFAGVEIAPTRIFPEQPYNCLEEAEKFAKQLREEYQLQIPSMQSIWFGQTGNLFANQESREQLSEYTKKAMLFAEKISCKNLVFGCPRNRNMPEGTTKQEQFQYMDMAIAFFDELADFALAHNTVVSMEANPTIYNTNFVNETVQAFTLVKEVNKQGFQINLDLGTMIQNDENPDMIKLDKMVSYINHVHISEPRLASIQQREIHKQVKAILLEQGYDKFVSLEMGKQDNKQLLLQSMEYMVETFNN